MTRSCFFFADRAPSLHVVRHSRRRNAESISRYVFSIQLRATDFFQVVVFHLPKRDFVGHSNSRLDSGNSMRNILVGNAPKSINKCSSITASARKPSYFNSKIHLGSSNGAGRFRAASAGIGGTSLFSE